MVIIGIFLLVGFLFSAGILLGTIYKKVGDLKENYPKKTFVVYRALLRPQRAVRFVCYAIAAGALICVMVGFAEMYRYDDPRNIYKFLKGCVGIMAIGGTVMYFPLAYSLPNDLMIFTPDAMWLHERQDKYLSLRPEELDSVVIDAWTCFPQGPLSEFRSRWFPWYYQTHVKVIKIDGENVRTYEMVLVNCREEKLEQKIRSFYPDLKIYIQKKNFREVAG